MSKSQPDPNPRLQRVPFPPDPADGPVTLPDVYPGKDPNPEQLEQAQRPGGGGAPGTGQAPPGSQVPPSPGEGVTEEQMDASGRED